MSLFNRIGNARGPSGNANSNPGNRPVCQFFLDGRCRFGADCRNYHPPRDSNSPAATQGRGSNQQLPYYLNADHVKADLTTGDERPSWPLSAYGPGREAPRQLLEGVLEQSPEELRTQYYLARATGGNTQEYERNETAALQQANGRVQSILGDIDAALKYVIDGKDVHPNREDEVKKAAGNFPWRERPSSDPVGATASMGGSTFGQPSNPSGGGTSTFGQPSTFGASSSPFGGARPQTAGSAFGQPSTLGGGQTTAPFGGQQQQQPLSAFGAPSALGSSFGRPSPFGGGGGTNTGTAFGQASTLGGSSPFGGGMNTSNTQGSAFGQASSLGGGGGSAFRKPSPLGSASGMSTATPAFGSSTPFGASTSQQAGGTPAFGQPSSQGSVFGQPSTANAQPSAFGANSASPFAGAAGTASSSAFGQPSQPNSRPAFGSPSPFAAAANNNNTTTTTSATPRPNPFSTTPNPNPTTNTSTAPRAPGQPLTTFKNQPVTTENRLSYYPNPAANGRKERIWFPDGAPGPNADAEAEPPQEKYYDESTAVGAALRKVYDYVRQHGVFEDGVVPEIPPKREWVGFDI